MGAAPTSKDLLPFDDALWEVWACSPGNYTAPRVDAWFEMHSLDRKFCPGNDPYIRALQTHSRVYVAKEDARLPHAIVYPKDEIYKFYGNGPFLDTFFQSSVSFMLAMAIKLKPEVVGLWGIDMAAADEYGQQRPGCHFFFNEAHKLGVNIVAPPQSDILEPLPLYGYKEQLPMYWRQKARKMELRGRVQECDALINQKMHEKHMLEGSLQDIEYTNNTYLRKR